MLSNKERAAAHVVHSHGQHTEHAHTLEDYDNHQQPIDEEVLTKHRTERLCKVCTKVIKVMIRRNTDFCSENCEKESNGKEAEVSGGSDGGISGEPGSSNP